MNEQRCETCRHGEQMAAKEFKMKFPYWRCNLAEPRIPNAFMYYRDTDCRIGRYEPT